MTSPCEYHTQLVTDIAVIKNDLSYIRASVDKKDKKLEAHVDEGEKQGGFRDRVLILEQEVSALRKSVWKIGATAGLIGALIGEATPELIKWVIGLIK